MTPVPTALVLAGGSWIGLHVGVAGTALRGVVARRTGENGFRIVFSTLSVATIAFLVISYRNARAQGSPTLWTTPHWLGWLLVLLMAPAFVLLVGSMTRPNPTAIGGEKLAGQEPRGLSRITRHPMLWSFATWSVVHVIGNGDLVSLLFFGTFGVTALLGMPSIDHKLAARDPAAWRTAGLDDVDPAVRRDPGRTQPAGATRDRLDRAGSGTGALGPAGAGASVAVRRVAAAVLTHCCTARAACCSGRRRHGRRAPCRLSGCGARPLPAGTMRTAPSRPAERRPRRRGDRHRQQSPPPRRRSPAWRR